MTTKAEREEIWQIITLLANQGLNVQAYHVEDQYLKVTLSVPLLSRM
jgi:hypothetical protein